MPADTVAQVLAEIQERLATVSAEREQLEQDLQDRLEPLREEERRLKAAAAALDAS